MKKYFNIINGKIVIFVMFVCLLLISGCAKKYTVTYQTDGGVFSDGSNTYVETVKKGTTVNLHEAPTKEGYTFLGWYFCCFWLPAYLRDIYSAQDATLSMQDTLDRIQWIGGIPFLIGAVGGVLSSVWSDAMVRRGSDSLAARKRMMISTVAVAPLCMLVPYLGEWIGDVDAQVAVTVAIFSLIAVMCLSWLYTICVVIAESFPVKNVASVVGITAGAGAVGGAVFNIFVGDMLSSMGNVLFIIMGLLHVAAALLLWRMVRRESPDKYALKR